MANSIPANQRSKTLWIIAASIACGLMMHFAGFPNSIFILTWLAPAGMVIICNKASPRQAFMAGFIYGVAMGTIILFQLLDAIGVPPYAIIGFIILNALIPSLIFGLSRALVKTEKGLAWLPWVFAAVQCTIYLVIEYPMAGGHIILLTAAQYQLSFAHAVAAAGGQYLLLFVLGLLSATVAMVILQRTRPVVISALLAAVFCAMVIIIGNYAPVSGNGNITAAAVVHKKDKALATKWGSNKADSVTLTDALMELANYERLSDSAIARGAKLIVWNEYGLRVRSAWKDSINAEVRRFAQNRQVTITACYINADDKLNNALTVSPAGGATLYAKKYLVPMDESLWLHSGKQDFAPITLPASNIKAAVRICYDNDFPSGSRAARQTGTNLFINPAADWKEIAAMHLASHSFRASENGIPMIRATSNGYSAFINGRGQITAQQETFTQDGLLVGQLDLSERHTLYTYSGNWIFYIGTAILITALVRRRSGQQIKKRVMMRSVA